MATMNTADIGFEREIWKAADKMRGNIDASEYKSVVLGLIFLKYISDKHRNRKTYYKLKRLSLCHILHVIFLHIRLSVIFIFRPRL